MNDLREAKERGYISKLPCQNSVLNALESADMTAILRDLIIESSLPLKAVESEFAVDSSGFTTSRFQSWFDHKYGHDARESLPLYLLANGVPEDRIASQKLMRAVNRADVPVTVEAWRERAGFMDAVAGRK